MDPAPSRRLVLGAGLASVGALGATGPAAALDRRPTSAARPLGADPFTLGVASGDPGPGGFVIWTRLALHPLAADGLGAMPARRVRVEWQVALDQRFRRSVRTGSVLTGPSRAHSVHVEVGGLRADRHYFYRFRVGAYLSPTGRTRTTPARGLAPGSTPPLDLAFLSCSHFGEGWFGAYAAVAAEQPDLVVHLGDYIYESPAGREAVRPWLAGPEATTLAGYRQRYAQYHTDPDLQAAHAAAPWLVVPDDHEVDNNYAALTSADPTYAGSFAARRRVAYRAYYENMPLRAAAAPSGRDMRLYRRVTWGSLATVHLLDTRQHRDVQCAPGDKECLAHLERTLLGDEQEQWLAAGLRGSGARWDLLAQQVFFGRRDANPSAATSVAVDAWDGYPGARDRVVGSWIEAGTANPVVLTGDVHAHWAGDLTAPGAEPGTAAVGSELVTSSISSGGDGYDEPSGRHPWFDLNPDLRFWTNLRGYVSATLTSDALTARFRCVPRVTVRDAGARTRAVWAIEAGVRGLQEVSSTPLTTSGATGTRGARPAPRSEAEIVADTIEQETGQRPGS